MTEATGSCYEDEMKHVDSHSVICTLVYLLANGLAKTLCSLHPMVDAKTRCSEDELKRVDNHSVICTLVYLLANGVVKT